MKKIGLGIGLCLALALQSQAALVLDLGSGTEPTGAGSITITDVDATATSGIDSIATVGTLSSANDLGNLGLTAAAAGFFNDGVWSITGNDFTILTNGVISTGGAGWGAIGGGISKFKNGQALALTFDTSSLNLGVGESLVLKSFSTDITTDAIEYILDGISLSALNPDSALGTVYTVNTTITDGLQIVWTGHGASDSPRLAELQLEVIPEPATLGLVGTFGLAILFIRRRFLK